MEDTIRQSMDIPDEKKRMLLKLWDGPDPWMVEPIPDASAAFAGGLDAVTIRNPGHPGGRVGVRDELVHGASINDRQAKERLDAVIFHELFDATGEGELDCEVLENLVFARHGATPQAKMTPGS